jgi:serine/threonine-protein kinase
MPNRAVPQTASLQSVQVELEKIQASRTLGRSERLCGLLRFIIERAIAKPGEPIKEYCIGTAVFDRPESYDPRSDPIVRVEARRLRTKLKEYYRSEGSDDAVVIDLPKGRYRPVIRAHSLEARRGQSEGGTPLMQSRTIAVLPFAFLSPGKEGAMFARGLTDELTDALTKCSGLRVLVWQSGLPFVGTDGAQLKARDTETVHAALQGSIRRRKDTIRVSAQLIHLSDAAVLWSEIYEKRVSDRLAVQREIARAISQAVLPAAANCNPSAAARPTATISIPEGYFPNAGTGRVRQRHTI